MMFTQHSDLINKNIVAKNDHYLDFLRALLGLGCGVGGGYGGADGGHSLG